MIVSDCCRGNEAEHRRGDIVVQATSQLLCITQRSGPEELFGQRSPPPEHEDAAAPVPEHLTPSLRPASLAGAAGAGPSLSGI